ncbi:MAG: hypothetical protein ACF8R7_10250, partial [Phycisphaerales bacterium JB039]
MSDRFDIPSDVAAELEAIDALDDQFDAELDELDDDFEDAARSAGQQRVGQDSILPTSEPRAQHPDPIALDHLYELLTHGAPAEIAEHLGWALTDLLQVISREDFTALAHKHSEALRTIAIINAAAALPEAIEALRACCAEAEDLRDRRLAAQTLLRFLTRPPSCRSPAAGGGAVSRSETEGVNQVRERSDSCRAPPARGGA